MNKVEVIRTALPRRDPTRRRANPHEGGGTLTIQPGHLYMNFKTKYDKDLRKNPDILSFSTR